MTTSSRWLPAVGCLPLGLLAGAVLSGPISHGQNPAPLAPALPREMTSYRDVVKRVLPGVVSIDARAKPRKPVSGRGRQPGDEPDDGNLGFGSGFIVDPSGLILTNYHVVEGADELDVYTNDGRKFTTTDFKADRRSDLAIVRVKARSPLPSLPFGDSDAMEIGDRVLAIGAPFGLKGSVTSGIISAKGRSLRLNTYEDFLQTDAAVNPGNSGGPLVNLQGQVVGVTSAIKSRSGGFQGVGLAIASNLARSILTQLVRDGVVKRGYLGAIVDDLDPDTLIRVGVRGVRTTKVVPDSPAARAGVRVGDIITMVADRGIKDSRDMQRIVADLPLNRPVSVSLLRDGKLMTVAVTITDYPENEPTSRKPPPRERQ